MKKRNLSLKQLAFSSSKKELYKIAILFEGNDEESWKLGFDLLKTNSYFLRYKPTEEGFSNVFNFLASDWDINFQPSLLDQVCVTLAKSNKFKYMFKHYEPKSTFYRWKKIYFDQMFLYGQLNIYNNM